MCTTTLGLDAFAIVFQGTVLIFMQFGHGFNFIIPVWISFKFIMCQSDLSVYLPHESKDHCSVLLTLTWKQMVWSSLFNYNLYIRRGFELWRAWTGTTISMEGEMEERGWIQLCTAYTLKTSLFCNRTSWNWKVFEVGESTFSVLNFWESQNANECSFQWKRKRGHL